MYATNYFEKGQLGTLLDVDFAAPAAIYVALYLSEPGELGAGTEVAYEGYARKAISFSAPAPMNGGVGVQSDVEVAFPQAPTDAGSATHIGILDSAVGGNMLLYGQMTDSLEIKAGTTPRLLAGEITYYLTGNLSTAYKTKTLNLLRGVTLQGIVPHVALYNGSPDAGGSELVGANYARLAITFSAPAESDSGQMITQNTADGSFPRPSTDWGTWSYTVIQDAAAGGQPVWLQEKSPAWRLKKGYMPWFEAGAVKVAFN